MSLWRSVQLKTPTPSIASTATVPSISAALNSANTPDASSAYQSTPAALSSKLLMPSFIFTYLCMGEFAAFVVGWNLLLEHVIGVALVAKGIAAYVDMLIFDRAGVNITLTQVQPVSSNISDYFDFFGFLIPILAGGNSKHIRRGVLEAFLVDELISIFKHLHTFTGPLVLILRRSIVLSTLSVICSIAVVIFILILGIVNGKISLLLIANCRIICFLSILSADVSNWTATPPTNSSGRIGNGGFFPFGVSGTLQGAALVLFTFIGFDSMVYYPLNWYTSQASKIVEFQRTVTTSILSINGILSLSLIGATVALTSVWPYYSLVRISGWNALGALHAIRTWAKGVRTAKT